MWCIVNVGWVLNDICIYMVVPITKQKLNSVNTPYVNPHGFETRSHDNQQLCKASTNHMHPSGPLVYPPTFYIKT